MRKIVVEITLSGTDEKLYKDSTALQYVESITYDGEWDKPNTDSKFTILSDTADPQVGRKADAERYRKALQEITKGEGEFNISPLEHAKNTIENLIEIAKNALRADAEEAGE